MTALGEMLEELRKLDPETGSSLSGIANIIVIYSDGKVSSDVDWMDDIIQGEVQRAIERRKWIYETVSPDTISDDHLARIFKHGEEYAKRLDDPTIVFYQAAADSPAAAILTAYLATIKATGGKE